MLAGRLVIGVAYVAFAIAGFVALEVIEPLRSTAWERAVIAVVGIKAVVNMAVEAGVPVKPGAGADEDSAEKPVGAVVAVGADWSDPDVDADLGAGGRDRWSAYKGNCER